MHIHISHRPYGTSKNLKLNSLFMMEVRYERGIYLPKQDLWLDPRDAKRFAFVSHAHSDHIAPHDEIIVSEHCATHASAAPRDAHRAGVALRRKANGARSQCNAVARRSHFRFGPIFPFRQKGNVALYRRFQIASGKIRRTGAMAPGRHADYGNHLWAAALSISTD